MNAQTYSPNVVVIGAGIAGLTTALEAARGGATVAVVDVASVFGGHAVVSEGGLALIDTPLQSRLGVKDSADIAYKDFVQWGEDPSYTVLDDGTGNDDHPHADIRNGDAFLSSIFQALTSNRRAWQNTVLIINFDEWGGFFEHVPPPRAVAPNQIDTDLVNGQALPGFRVPAIVASPFTRGAGVSDMVCDHTSVLKLIEWRGGLQPLTSRDASPQIGNPAAVMNFAHPDASVPSLPRPSTVFAPACFQGGIFDPESISGETPAVSARRVRRTVASDSPWKALATTQVMAEWKRHPRFRAHLEKELPSLRYH